MPNPNLPPWPQEDLDWLDDLVAEDRYSFAQIGKMMGRSRDSITSQWRRTVKEMGRQGR